MEIWTRLMIWFWTIDKLREFCESNAPGLYLKYTPLGACLIQTPRAVYFSIIIEISIFSQIIDGTEPYCPFRARTTFVHAAAPWQKGTTDNGSQKLINMPVMPCCEWVLGSIDVDKFKDNMVQDQYIRLDQNFKNVIYNCHQVPVRVYVSSAEQASFQCHVRK